MLHRLRRGFASGATKSSSLYDILKVPRTSSADDIKKAYKKAALEHHPDRGGNVDTFKEISSAYSILSDPEKRAVYDQYGDAGMAENGARGGGPSGFDPMDIFSQAFGGSARRSHGGLMRGRDAVYKMELTLDEIATGTQRNIAFTRDVSCKTCGGRGATKIDPCNRCGGSGVVMTKQNIGFLVHMQSACPDCEGQGYKVPRGGLCSPCKGGGIVSEKESFEVRIPKGCPTGHQIRFANKGDHLPGHTAGDVVVQITEKTQTTKRVAPNSPDLCIAHTVSLADSLAGSQIPFKSVGADKRDIPLATTNVVAPGDVWVARGLGLPRFEGTTNGDLYIRFDVKFPKDISQLSPVERDRLMQLLQGKLAGDNDTGVVKLEKIGSSETIKKIQRALESPQEEPRGGRQQHQAHPNECQQQ
jgi:DnaJ homolog subfamily A member 2